MAYDDTNNNDSQEQQALTAMDKALLGQGLAINDNAANQLVHALKFQGPEAGDSSLPRATLTQAHESQPPRSVAHFAVHTGTG